MKCILLFTLVSMIQVNAFQPIKPAPTCFVGHRSNTSVKPRTVVFSNNNDNNVNEFNDFEEGIGKSSSGSGSSGSDDDNTDWDAEWKKVMENRDQPNIRPGTDFYKNDMERAAIRASKVAQEQMTNIQENVNLDPPDIRSLRGDGKFWIAVLAVISIGAAVLSASGQGPPQNYLNDSYYI